MGSLLHPNSSLSSRILHSHSQDCLFAPVHGGKDGPHIHHPEIFEEVLLLLPLKELLVNAQRVCRHWHITIVSSLRLQRALFFVPATRQPDFCTLRRTGGPDYGVEPPAPNPFGDLISIREYTNRSAAFDYRFASWRRMLVSQPQQESMVLLSDLGRHGSGSMPRVVFINLPDCPQVSTHCLSYTGPRFASLTFEDIDRELQRSMKRHGCVVLDRVVLWKTAAFELEGEELH